MHIFRRMLNWMMDFEAVTDVKHEKKTESLNRKQENALWLDLHHTVQVTQFWFLWHRSLKWVCQQEKKSLWICILSDQIQASFLQCICSPCRRIRSSAALKLQTSRLQKELASVSSALKCELFHSVLLFWSPTECVMNTTLQAHTTLGQRSAQIPPRNNPN